MMRQDILFGKITEIEHITFDCQYCNKGVKTIDKNKYFDGESGFSRNEFTEIANSFHTKFHKRFSAAFICSNPKCKDISIVVGDINSKLIFCDEMHEGQIVSIPSYDKKINIYSITPTLHLFDVNRYNFNNPNIKFELENAFKVFWIDANSYGNKIRTFFEALLDDFSIPKQYIDRKGKEQVYGLHTRIDFFEKKFPNERLKQILINIKVKTNDGSHFGKKLTKQDSIILTEMVELILNQLFIDDRNRLEELNNRILISQ